MSITFKLIGYQADKEFDFIWSSCNNLQKDKNSFCLKDIYEIFIRKGINIKDLKDNIKFITNGARLQNLEESFNCPLTIFIFTNIPTAREALLKNIFTSIPNQKSKFNVSTNKKLNNNQLQDNISNEENIIDMDEINKKILESFKDPDFLILLKICINKPELLNMMNGYLSSGNIISGELKDIENLENFKFEKEFNIIKDLLQKNNINIKFNEHNLKKILNQFDGHINLTLRYLIHSQINNTQEVL